ncbi:MAG TPA: hypothetical protein VGF52_03540 [Tepidisphaeraceae bacterium]
MASTIVLCKNLLFVSKISATAAAAGVPIQLIREVSKLFPETEARRMIVDLNQDGFLAAAADWKRRSGGKVIGFVSHTDGETIAQAKAEGLDKILARSGFVAQLEQILQDE